MRGALSRPRPPDAELYREFSYHQAEVDRLRQLRGQRPSREEREQSLAHVLGMLDTLFTVPTAQTAALLRRAGIRMYIRDGLVSEIRLE